MSNTKIHPFPELRALAWDDAQAMAEACADAFALHMGDDTPAMYELGWDGMHDDEKESLAAAHLALLCDLTRPASRDAVARLVALQMGWPADWVTAACEGDWPKMGSLRRATGLPDPERMEPRLPPAEALALIVRHLWPQES